MNGLSSEQAKNLLSTHGQNILKETGREPLWKKFLSQFTDFMVLTLIGAAAISFVSALMENNFEEMLDVYMIVGIIIVNSIIGFIQEYKSEKAIEALQKMVSPQARVFRNGKLVSIEARFIVPGDLLFLEAGDKVAADAKLVETNEFRVDESVLTGESDPVRKDCKEKTPEKSHVFMGTGVTNGTAKAIVTKTGMNTEFGKIAHLTSSTKKDKTPLQKELKSVGVFIGKIALLISALLLILGYTVQGHSFINSLLFAVAVAVAAVPEGLPAIVTITLAIGVQRLAKKRAIIKQLSSVETLGSTTVICSDKTGTLTKNEMTVKEIILGNGSPIEVNGSGYDPADGTIHVGKSFDTVAMTSLLSICKFCTNTTIEEKNGTWDAVGDPTEAALLTLAMKGEKNIKIKIQETARLAEFPFDSVRKRMSVIVSSDNKKLVLTKGAPDSILKICTKILIDGKEIDMTEDHRNTIMKKNDAMAAKALRVLAFAQKEIYSAVESENQAEEKMVFVGLAGMIDPPRPEVKEAVRLCERAGIRIIIITGDYGQTALAIGKNIGIVKLDTPLISGDELENMSDEKLKKVLSGKGSVIFARIKPEHKLRVVEVLKALGHIVAVTGDGVNDAPALKRADIGVAMGIAGTEVSKEAANMILTDDSFASIVTAVSEGRGIYENLKKFIWFILSCNIGEVLTIFLSIIMFLPSPLSAILILAVNMGTDVLPALALGLEKKESYIMNLPPRNPKKRILHRKFIFRMFSVGLLVSIVVIGVYLWMLMKQGWTIGIFPDESSIMQMKATTAAFAALVLTQLFNALNARSERTSIMKLPVNFHLLGALAISVGLIIGITEIPIFQTLFKTSGLTATEWLVVTLSSSIILIVEELRKRIAPAVFDSEEK